jgi:hypothetical protein
MRNYNFKAIIKAALRVACILPFAAVAAFGQQQVNLTAAPATAPLPDGSAVPMWGYSCGAAVTGSTATCTALNPAAGAGMWSPVVITVPTGQALTINLTNGLPAPVPTSITIVGQVGGGLGVLGQRTTTQAPKHDNQPVTWSTANAAGGVFTPPPQGPRVQSFATEVAPGATMALSWSLLKPGTYLIESGTHPSIQGPMGLYGILVVTCPPGAAVGACTAPGTAYPVNGTNTGAVTYNAEVPLLLSEIDPAQNNSVNTAVNTAGFNESSTLGPFLGVAIASLKLTSGGSGYTASATVNFTGGGGSGATASVTVDTTTGSPTFGQVTGITLLTPGTGYTSAPTVQITDTAVTIPATAVAALLLQPNGIAHCSGGAAACYPPAVNYTPLYYTINGVAFNKTNATGSLFAATPGTVATPVSGNVLVRLVNAGLRMHVPAILGSQTMQTSTSSAVGGFSLIAEDGNPLPGLPRVQTEVFMAAGKTYDVMINAPATGANALPIYDRELSLSANATQRDAGMLAYISVNGSAIQAGIPALGGATANTDNYYLVAGNTLTVSDPSKGVLANDVNVLGAKMSTPPTGGTVALNLDGTFTYVPNAGTLSDSFMYCGNGTTSGAACATVNLNQCTVAAGCLEAANGITVNNIAFNSNVATYLKIPSPGVLSVDSDSKGHPLSVNVGSVVQGAGLTLAIDSHGGFSASVPAAGTYYFGYSVKNSQGTASTTSACTADPTATAVAGCGLVSLTFPTGSGLTVTVLDGKDRTSTITDYRWIIEEDKTLYVDPTKTTNQGPNGPLVPVLGVNFHTSHMTFVAQGCTGAVSCEAGQTVFDPVSVTHIPAVCDLGDGVCRSATQKTAVLPGAVALDPTKRYYISILPGDAGTPFATGNTSANCANGAGAPGASNCGHTMGGASILFPAANTAVTALVEPGPFPPGKLSVSVFEDDFPLNGEQDAGGGVDVLATNEPGLGGFNLVLVDQAGRFGDVTGQMTYDMFNQPLSNALSGQKDAATGLDACPIANQATSDPTQVGITGMIVTCPKYESDGKTLSPLAGQAVIANLMPGFYSVIATPGADRIARGEEWLQTNTLDGQKAHDAFIRIGEPAYFQEYGPAGYHDSIGFANPAIINARKAGVCGGSDPNLTGKNCTNSVTGKITSARVSRPPDERLYSSGSHDAYYWTQCYVSFGDPDGEDFAFTKCNADGTFTLSGLPDGSWRLTIFDQWNDQIVDGLSTPVFLSGGKLVDMGDIPEQQWQTNVYTRTFIDDNKDGVSQSTEAGIPLINTTVRYRDGSLANNLLTDFTGTANFNETFPLFAWYVVEADTTRYKTTGIHTVYDVGGPADGSAACSQTGYPACGNSTIGKFLANTAEKISLPINLRVPGAVYCANADCTGASIQNGPSSSAPPTSGTTYLSSGRIDAPWVAAEGWQGFIGQNNFIEFGKTPYAPGENGGIHGHVVYASTRPFDDPYMLVQTQWEPLIPNVTINLYQEGTAPDGSQSLKLVDTTQTSSWDDWSQGFRSDGMPNMNCPGQGRDTGTAADLFFFTLFNQPNYLNLYNSQHGGPAPTALPYNSQFKCYDGLHSFNQLQPAPYDGMYSFPSVTGLDPMTGKPTGTNCTGCTKNPDSTDPYRFGLPMLPAGKYVVEVVPPPGYELVKEEDKNILIGDNFIAPITQEFGGLGNIFILPDQAQVASAYNPYNPQNPTQSFGASPNNGIVPAFVPEPTWPCVGEARIVPDYISLFPQTQQVAPFAGASRNLCDRKEVTLGDQMGAIAKFFLYTSTHIAAKTTGIITDDFTSEFDPFSPSFGEKFSPANLPVSYRDWTGAEISRVYTDWWGVFDGMTYSTWEVNPPNPTGYAPTMMVTCMNDPGPIPDPAHPGQMITDPLFNPYYSQFCYENPFMPGATSYLDTPVVPTAAFVSAGYNNPDCNYPDATPAISEVDGDGVGPWVSAAGNTLTIKALGDQMVNNYAYSGPAATAAPYNQKTIKRHYGFGNTKGSGSVTIGGRTAPVVPGGWSDTQITVTVPENVPSCAVQQQVQYGGPDGTTSPFARCGELVITAANGKQSVDTVTVTIGGKAPTHVPASGTIQSAIDAAAPGDLIIVDPTCLAAGAQVPCTTAGGATISASAHNELLIMWKPVRLQGVGAASTVINANTHPAGKLDPWRQRIDCLFGVALNGQPYTSGTGTNPYDSTGKVGCPGTGWQYFAGGPNNPQVDRIPLEGIVGWDTTVNGNLAELLQEPSLMGAYEGAGITVVGKGVNIPPGSANVFGNGSEANFPTGSTLLTSANCGTGSAGADNYVANPFPSNFQCNPSSIDGLTVSDSSQGGGGIFLHAWGHNLQIANNRVTNNAGTLSGGISVGQGEFPDAYLAPNSGVTAPGSCQDSPIANTQLPYCLNLNVNVNHNMVVSNSSTGDELFSATPAGGGGVSFCTGADFYEFNYNWVCGNISTGDGGGVAHLGFSYNGHIEHNQILFNQSTNPTIPTNGGGLIVMGAAPDGSTIVNGVVTECGSVTDNDCVPGLSDGVGPGTVINANLFQGNAADSGSGGAIRFQAVNGADVPRFPANPERWYSVQVTNNIINNNVAGWDGAGVSLEDSLEVNLVNNTIVSNDTTASSGILFSTIGAPLASTQSPPPTTTNNGTTSLPQPAGLVTMQNSPQLTSSFTTGAITCPTGHYSGALATNGTCTKVSYPLLDNNLFWQNRAFNIGVGALSPAVQQNIVTMFNAISGTPAATQPAADATTANGNGFIITGGTGACTPGATYWDIGVRGDTGPGNHDSGFTLAPTYSVLTNSSENGNGTNNFLATNPAFVGEYCNGSRVPPENGGMGYNVPAGISDATLPNPIFSLTPSATVDEGNNWINVSWGPLTMTNPVSGALLGDYEPAAGSPIIDAIPTSSPTFAVTPRTDFFGNPRPDPAVPNRFDVGAVEFLNSANGPKLSSITPNTGLRGTNVAVTLIGSDLVALAGATSVNVSGAGVTVTSITVVSDSEIMATFSITTTAGLTTRNVTVTTPNGTSNAVTFTVFGPTLTSIAPNTGAQGTSVNVTFTGTNLTGATMGNGFGNLITATNFVVVNSTTVTGTFNIGPSAPTGVRNVSLSTPAGLTNTLPFTVVAPPAPTLTAISPVSGLRGTAVPVTLTGTNFTATGTTVAVAGGGVTVSGVNVVSATQITATFTIAANASLTPATRTVTVTTPGGTSGGGVTFTLLGPSLTSIAPTTGARGTVVPVTLTGTGLTGATAVTVSGAGVTVSGVTVVNDATVTANFTITATAGLTPRTVTVTAPGGTSNTETFTVVNPPTATLTSISPISGLHGTAVAVTLVGTNFTATGTTVAVSGSGVTVSGITASATGTQLTATFAITSGAARTPRNVTVTNPSGTASNTQTFTVN